MDVGTVGVWAAQLRSRDLKKVAGVARFLEDQGYGTAWVPGGTGGDLFEAMDTALDATRRITVASGILNIWMHEAADTASWFTGARARHPERILLGLGASHAPLVEASGQAYVKPLTAVRQYLDLLSAAHPPVPEKHLALGALGPKMLDLAGARTRGAHPYLTDPTHTHAARQRLGPDALLAPELKVVLDTDPDRARAVARAHLGVYLGLPNYTNNLLRTGFTEDDLADGGSDRLIDGVVAWGDVDTVVERARAHWTAGADHVCIQVLSADRTEVPYDAWRALAGPLSTAGKLAASKA